MKGIIILITIAVISVSYAATNKIVCYFSSRSVYRPNKGRFDVESINPKMCTHLVYAFASLNEDGFITVLDPRNDLTDNGGKGALKRFNDLHQQDENLKTLISVGGWEQGSIFSKVVAHSDLRINFVKSAVLFIKTYGFDGLDIDWEYPVEPNRGGRPEDLANFVRLLKEFRSAFRPRGYLLTAAVAGPEAEAIRYYDILEISRYLDFISVMSYDLHGSWDGITGNNAPLEVSPNDTDPGMNVRAVFNAWIRNGALPEKLIMGVPFYGRSFVLRNPGSSGVGAPTEGNGDEGPYTKRAGTLGYNEIVEKLKSGELLRAWDGTQKVPYAYGAGQWVGYDDPESVREKCDLARQLRLGGVMAWSIDTDDFQGVSGVQFPLLRMMNSALGRNI